MLYFFHIVGGSELFPDELGRSLPTLESAKRHAKVLADELRKGGDFCGSSLVRAVDEDGNTVFECTVSSPKSD
jgi:Domain of unknown function (DUF6894)